MHCNKFYQEVDNREYRLKSLHLLRYLIPKKRIQLSEYNYESIVITLHGIFLTHFSSLSAFLTLKNH